MRITLLLLLASFTSLYSVHAQSGKEPVRITDMLRIRGITDVTISRDGSKAAFTVNTIESDPSSKWDYRYINQLYLTAADGSATPKQLTVKEGASQPAWSPDGKQIAFVRSVDGKPQIFILSLDGGEPAQFTHFRYGAGTPKWSPDGKAILFSSSIPLKDAIRDSILNPGHLLPAWPYERAADQTNNSLAISTAKPDPDGSIDEIRAYLENDIADKKAKLITRLDFQDELVVNNDMSFNQFFVQETGANAQPVLVSKPFYRFTSAEFTPDGRQLIFVASVDSSAHPDRVQESAIYIAAMDGSNFHLFAGQKGKIYSGASLSPSGKTLAIQISDTGGATIPQIAITPFTGTASWTILPFDRNKGKLVWSTDEKYIYFTAQSNGGAPIYRMNTQTGKADQLTDFNSGVGSFDLRGNRIVYSLIQVSDPTDLYTADATAQNAKRITAFNYDWVQHKQLVQPEKHCFTNDKGLRIEYWVMKPANYEAGKKYPLLLDIHGGPTAMWGPGEASMWHEFQFFCAKGYGVVYCNPRGSGGYGEEFMRANIKNWGDGPTSDVLTAVDKTVAEGWADTSKLVISGGSYAGYLTAYIIGHDHRFKAACAQRGVYDLATFFGEGNAWRLVPNYFGGYPWQPDTKAVLAHESPISYVDKITTPLIIFHGENDRRTGFVQGEMLFRSLKVLGRPVEYVRHPGATHEITRSGDNRQRIDQMLRTYDFFERYIHH